MDEEITVASLEKALNYKPHAVFAAQRMIENIAHGPPYNTEDGGQRQTGRTTYLLMKAIVNVCNGRSVVIYASSTTYVRILINKIDDILNRAKVPFKITGQNVWIADKAGRSIHVCKFSHDNHPAANNAYEVHYFDDTMNDLWG